MVAHRRSRIPPRSSEHGQAQRDGDPMPIVVPLVRRCPRISHSSKPTKLSPHHMWLHDRRNRLCRVSSLHTRSWAMPSGTALPFSPLLSQNVCCLPHFCFFSVRAPTARGVLSSAPILMPFAFSDRNPSTSAASCLPSHGHDAICTSAVCSRLGIQLHRKSSLECVYACSAQSHRWTTRSGFLHANSDFGMVCWHLRRLLLERGASRAEGEGRCSVRCHGCPLGCVGSQPRSSRDLMKLLVNFLIL